MRFRSIPRTVHAVQFTGDVDAVSEFLAEHAPPQPPNVDHVNIVVDLDGNPTIDALDIWITGEHRYARISTLDWVVVDDEGGVRPCDRATFAMIFRQVG